MSYKSAQAKHPTDHPTLSKKLRHKCKAVRRDYTNFAGSTVPPLSKEIYQKAMKGYLKQKGDWR